MAFESNGFYCNYNINGKDVDYNPSYVTNTSFEESIFKLYPEIYFEVSNLFNSLYQQGLFQPKNSLKIELGRGADDRNKTIIQDMVIESMALGAKMADLTGSGTIWATIKHKENLSRVSAARSWTKAPSSAVVTDILSSHNAAIDTIEQTSVLGNWLKPSSQTEYNFLEIIRNRSLPQFAKPSKMLMWFGLDGRFNFRSLGSMIAQIPVDYLDFTSSDMELFSPGGFHYIDEGIRYRLEQTSSGINRYDIQDGLKPIAPPNVGKVRGDLSFGVENKYPLNISSKVLYEYDHSLLPNDFTKAMYYNNYYNFPYQLTFTIKPSPKIKLGSVISITFRHHDPNEGTDKTLSGNYLVTYICKKERGSNFVMDIGCVSNSMIKDMTLF